MLHEIQQPDLRPDVRQLDDASTTRWDAFVETCPEGTFYHRAGWKRVIERSFGHKCYYLYAESNGRLRGVLPLVHQRSRLFANALISNAFCVSGGPLASDPAAYAALESAAVQLAESLGVEYLEFRHRKRMRDDWACNSERYVSFRKALDPDPEKNLLAIPRKQRRMVRKGIKLGLSGETDQGIDRFYGIYAESVRNLGTPVFAKRYFQNLVEQFSGDCDVLTVSESGRPLASVLSFYFRDQVHPYYGGSVRGARDLAANDFMYWALMEQACERGYRMFDFGRSKVGTGAYEFKRHWGFEPEPLFYEYNLLNRQDMPEFNPLNPKYRVFISLWRRLPLAVANRLGPLIAQGLG